MSTQPLGPEALGAVAPQPTFTRAPQPESGRGWLPYGAAGGVLALTATVVLLAGERSASASDGCNVTVRDSGTVGSDYKGVRLDWEFAGGGQHDGGGITGGTNGYVSLNEQMFVTKSGTGTWTVSGPDFNDPAEKQKVLLQRSESWKCTPAPAPSSSTKKPSPKPSPTPTPTHHRTTSAPAPHTSPASHPTTHVAAPQTSSEVVAPPPHHKPTHHASKSASKSKSAAASSSEASSSSASSASLSQAASSVVVSPSASSSLESTPAAANVKNTGGNGPIAPWVLGGLAIVAAGGTAAGLRRRGHWKHRGPGLIAGK